MPDPRELPRMRRAVVPLVRPGGALVAELVAHRLPGRPAVIGPLDHLPEPAVGLRRVQPIRVRGGPLDVVDLPACKVGAADVPPLPLAIRIQDERALARTHQYPYATHRHSLPPRPDAAAHRPRPGHRPAGPAAACLHGLSQPPDILTADRNKTHRRRPGRFRGRDGPGPGRSPVLAAVAARAVGGGRAAAGQLAPGSSALPPAGR